MHIMQIYAYVELTIVTGSTRLAARQEMIKPQRESSFCCLQAKLLLRQLNCGLVGQDSQEQCGA